MASNTRLTSTSQLWYLFQSSLGFRVWGPPTQIGVLGNPAFVARHHSLVFWRGCALSRACAKIGKNHVFDLFAHLVKVCKNPRVSYFASLIFKNCPKSTIFPLFWKDAFPKIRNIPRALALCAGQSRQQTLFLDIFRDGTECKSWCWSEMKLQQTKMKKRNGSKRANWKAMKPQTLTIKKPKMKGNHFTSSDPRHDISIQPREILCQPDRVRWG